MDIVSSYMDLPHREYGFTASLSVFLTVMHLVELQVRITFNVVCQRNDCIAANIGSVDVQYLAAVSINRHALAEHCFDGSQG